MFNVDSIFGGFDWLVRGGCGRAVTGKRHHTGTRLEQIRIARCVVPVALPATLEISSLLQLLTTRLVLTHRTGGLKNFFARHLQSFRLLPQCLDQVRRTVALQKLDLAEDA